MNLKNALCVVSGASSGIGKATSQMLAAKGARVVLLARSAEALKQLESQIRQEGGQAWAYPTDLTQAQAVQQTSQQILQQHGTPEVVVHSAGAGRWLFLDDTSPEELQQMMGAPYFATAYLAQALLPAMRQANRGYMVVVCSPASRLAWPGATGYVAARWALNGLTEALRADLWRTGIRVGAYFPGKVDSEYFSRNAGAEERIPRIGRLIPSSTPQRVAARLLLAIERQEAEAFYPWQLWLFDRFSRYFPAAARYFAYSTGHYRSP